MSMIHVTSNTANTVCYDAAELCAAAIRFQSANIYIDDTTYIINGVKLTKDEAIVLDACVFLNYSHYEAARDLRWTLQAMACYHKPHSLLITLDEAAAARRWVWENFEWVP